VQWIAVAFSSSFNTWEQYSTIPRARNFALWGFVMVSESSTHGWYYKHNGQTFGPVSTGQLQELLSSGRLPAQQVVWNQRQQQLLFVRAATAVCDTTRPYGGTNSRQR
jgi:hypothetical protein